MTSSTTRDQIQWTTNRGPIMGYELSAVDAGHAAPDEDHGHFRPHAFPSVMRAAARGIIATNE
jgi:hypothetical protein